MIVELCQLIAEYSQVREQITLFCLSKDNMDYIKIRDINLFIPDMTIILQPKFNNLVSLRTHFSINSISQNVKSANKDIIQTHIDIGHMKALRVLDCQTSEVILHIDGLHLEELYIYNNIIIGNDTLAKMKDTLQILHCNMINITQKQVMELRLEKLSMSRNYDILDLNHMKDTLRILECCHCYINQAGIADLRLVELVMYECWHIRDLNHMKDTLKKLNCSSSNIQQKNISSLRLETLYMQCAQGIFDLNFMKDTLKYLKCSYSEIDQNGIKDLSLIKLTMKCNQTIINLEHMKDTLIYLKCYESKILDTDMSYLVHTEIFDKY